MLRAEDLLLCPMGKSKRPQHEKRKALSAFREEEEEEKEEEPPASTRLMSERKRCPLLSELRSDNARVLACCVVCSERALHACNIRYTSIFCRLHVVIC